MKSLIIISSFLLGFAGCTNNPKTSENSHNTRPSDDSLEIIVEHEPTHEISFKKELVFGETDEVLLRFVGNFEVDDKNRVYIAEKKRIVVLDEHQNLVKQLGRAGRGPGEFDNMGGLRPRASKKRLFVYDDVLQRVNVFDLDSLQFMYAIPLEPTNWKQVPKLKYTNFKRYLVINDSLLLAGFKKPSPRGASETPYCRYYKMNKEGKLVSDEVIKIKDNGFYNGFGIPGPTLPNSPSAMPQTRSSMIDVGQSGTIYSAWTGSFDIRLTKRNGQKQDISYPIKNAPLNKSRVIEELAQNHRSRKGIKYDSFPETWPAIDYFFVDDEERIWVATISDDQNNFEWMVVSIHGELIAKFKWPAQKLKRHKIPREIQMVRNGYLYTKERNVETGRKEIIKYKIVLTKQ